MIIDSDSLADRDMEARISAMEPIFDELLDAATELPDHNELNELISQVHLLTDDSPRMYYKLPQ